MKQQRGDQMTNKQRTYTKEFRQEAVQFALNSPSVLKAAQDLGIPEATLHTGVQKAKRDQALFLL